MARKQYISIIRLFNHCSIPFEEAVNLSRIKKQLTAEFGLAASGFIEVDGFSYNKNDVLEEIERPDFAYRLGYHKRIWESKDVLIMLEQNSFSHNFRNQMRQFQNDDNFDIFFSPYFATPFNYSARNLLNSSSFDELGDLMAYEGFLLGADREEAFKSTRVFLEENVRILKNTNKDNYNIVQPKIQHWVQPNWSSFMNNLPDEYYNYRHDIAFYLVNTTVAIQKVNRKDCKAISHELTCLTDLSTDLSKTIYDNHKVYMHASTGTSSGGNYGWIIWGAIILVRILIGC